MSNVVQLDPKAAKSAASTFNARSLSGRSQTAYSALTYPALIKAAEDVLTDAQTDKTLLADIFETLVERYTDHPHIGYDATRLLEQTWDASPDIALGVMGNLTLLSDPKLLNSFYQTISEKLADRLEKDGSLDAIPQLALLKDMADRRGHSLWYKHLSNVYVGIFNQMVGDAKLANQSIGMLPEVLRTKADLRDRYDGASFDFIVDFLKDVSSEDPAFIFYAIYDIFESGAKLEPAHKNKLLDLAVQLSGDAPSFFEDSMRGVYLVCQFFSNFMSGKRDWHAKGLTAIDKALNNLRALYADMIDSPQVLDFTQSFIRQNHHNPNLCPALQKHLRGKLARSAVAPTP